MIPVSKTLETDIAVVGGGIGGLCAAIAAAEGGARVMVLEKANTKRSGSGATGNDHFACYYPKHHGGDIRPILRELLDSLVGLCHDPLLSLRFLERSISIVDKWHEWGINMKPFAEDYVFMGHAYPDRPRIWLKYDGHNQKEALTRQAKKVGVTIVNHHPAVDLMRDEQGITGVLALDVSGETPSFTFVKARKVILATGTANRLYPAAGLPGWPFNTAFCPACAGAAQAQGWRIGAKLVNMELPNRHAGPKFFARAGKSTWIGVYRYPNGKLLGPFVDKATREVGDITCDVWNSAYTDVLMNGTGPAYIDCTGTGPEDMAFMREGMASEGLTGLLNYMDEKGIDPSKHAVEFMQYEPHLIGRGLRDRHRRADLRTRPVRYRRHGGQLPRRHRRGRRLWLDRRGARRRPPRGRPSRGHRKHAVGAGAHGLLQPIHGTAFRGALEGSEPRPPADHGRLRRRRAAPRAFRDPAQRRAEVPRGSAAQRRSRNSGIRRPHPPARHRDAGSH